MELGWRRSLGESHARGLSQEEREGHPGGERREGLGGQRALALLRRLLPAQGEQAHLQDEDG